MRAGARGAVKVLAAESWVGKGVSAVKAAKHAFQGEWREAGLELLDTVTSVPTMLRLQQEAERQLGSQEEVRAFREFQKSSLCIHTMGSHGSDMQQYCGSEWRARAGRLVLERLGRRR
jgi:hypothetical protein